MRGPFKYGGGPFTVQIKDVCLGGGVMGRGGALKGFGDPPLEFWDPPPSWFWDPPPPPDLEVWGVVLECVAPLRGGG